MTEPMRVFAANDVADLNLYLLGTGDMLRIQVYDEKDLYLEARVSDSGTISYPFLGELKVKGMSLVGLEALITSRLKGDYLIDPKVSIDMIEYRRFYVNGEIENAGAFPPRRTGMPRRPSGRSSPSAIPITASSAKSSALPARTRTIAGWSIPSTAQAPLLSVSRSGAV